MFYDDSGGNPATMVNIGIDVRHIVSVQICATAATNGMRCRTHAPIPDAGSATASRGRHQEFTDL